MATIREALKTAAENHRAGQLQLAEHICHQVLQVVPDHSDALHLLGVIAYQSGNYAFAVDYITRAIAVNPNHAGLHNNLGEAYRATLQFEEAEACYRRSVEIEPEFAQAHNSLGIALQEQGRLDDAAASYRRALEIKPHLVEAQSNLGNVFIEQGKRDEAIASYNRALKVNPDFADGHFNLGNALQQQGDIEQALASYRRAIELDENLAEAHNNLGNLLREQKNLEQAADHYKRALEIDPGYAEAHNNLGGVFREQGELTAAMSCYDLALQAKPDYAEAIVNMGITFSDQGEPGRAMACYRRALEINPECVDALISLGNAFQEQGNSKRAVASWQRALEVKPESPEAHNNLGNAFKAQGELGQAIACYTRAIGLKSDYADAHNNLGSVFEEQEKLDQATASYRRALEIEPRQAIWELRIATLCPAVFQTNKEIDEYRRQLLDDLTRFQKSDFRFEVGSLLTSGSEPPFNIMYHGRDDRPIKEACAAIFRGRFSQQTPISRRSVPRIGFCVTRAHEAAFLRCMKGVIERLDHQSFEVVIICSRAAAAGIRNAIPDEAIGILAVASRLELFVESVRSENFDLLYYWEVGSDSANYFLPFFRLAPVQCTGWGVPTTSGISQVDYFLSSELVEPEDANQHYTETLIQSNTLLTYQVRASVPESARNRKDFGFTPQQHVYLCAQNIRKFHPDFDPILAGILREDKAGVVAITEDRHGYGGSDLRRRLSMTMPDVTDRIVFLPPRPYPDYLALLRSADVLLDPLYFGGAITSYDALSLNKPVVTLPTQFARGRYTLGCFRKMGLTNCVASTPEEYVTIAVRLGTDADFRKDVTRLIEEKSDVLFEDAQAVREYERIFRDLISRSS